MWERKNNAWFTWISSKNTPKQPFETAQRKCVSSKHKEKKDMRQNLTFDFLQNFYKSLHSIDFIGILENHSFVLNGIVEIFPIRILILRNSKISFCSKPDLRFTILWHDINFLIHINRQIILCLQSKYGASTSHFGISWTIFTYGMTIFYFARAITPPI